MESTASSGPGGAATRPRDAREMRLRTFYEARYNRVRTMLDAWSERLSPTDWRMRLIHRTLYSTWLDLHDSGTRAEEDGRGGAS